MSDKVWLASYPKSGNTWMRMMIGCLALKDGDRPDINQTPVRDGISSARFPFDNLTMIDSGLLTHDEIDALRPQVYAQMMRDGEDDPEDDAADLGPMRFAKVHDAYTRNAAGEPLLAGARGAKCAIVIVRDPRDVVPSLANHNRTPIDAAIDFLNDPGSAYCDRNDRQYIQLRQILRDWSGHVASWLDQRDLPVHLVKYDDLKRDAAGALLAALRFAGHPIAPDAAARAAALADFQTLQAQERETGFAEWRNPEAREKLFFRRGESDAWRDELTAEQVRRIEAAHAPMMRRLGYELSKVE